MKISIQTDEEVKTADVEPSVVSNVMIWYPGFEESLKPYHVRLGEIQSIRWFVSHMSEASFDNIEIQCQYAVIHIEKESSYPNTYNPFEIRSNSGNIIFWGNTILNMTPPDL